MIRKLLPGASQEQQNRFLLKFHNSASRLCIVDWDGEAYRMNKQVYRTGCDVYSNVFPKLDSGEVAQGMTLNCDNAVDWVSWHFSEHVWGRDQQNTGQCETIIHPKSWLNDDCFLLIEIKYCTNSGNVDKKLDKHTSKAQKQIKDTATKLKSLGCPLQERNLYGVISLPLLPTKVMGAFLYSEENIREFFLKEGIRLLVGNSIHLDTQTQQCHIDASL